MYMVYLTGFIDLYTRTFYSNIGNGHGLNAKSIILDNPKLQAMYERESEYKNFEDFLIFRANYAKVGMAGQRCVIIKSTSPFKNSMKIILRECNIPEDYTVIEWIH